MQVGNGFFAFGADVTGLQTFLPFATMSDWGWKNDSLPAGTTLRTLPPVAHRGPEPHEPRARRLLFVGADGEARNVTEADLSGVRQELDLWTGTLESRFMLDGQAVVVRTYAAQSGGAIGITVESQLVQQGGLGLFLDFPWNDGSQKFEAPFVGEWNMTANHTTELRTGEGLGINVHAQINHTLDAATFVTSVGGGDAFSISRDSPDAHRYTVLPARGQATSFSIAVSYGLSPPASMMTVNDIVAESTQRPTRDELQRRIILSRYLMRVNEAGHTPPQESGLVNNGWYGKFHMEMYFWHSAHWALWNNWDLLNRSNSVYTRYMPTAIERAQVQEGYSTGARWSKMTDPQDALPQGRSTIRVPRPSTRATLEAWRAVVRVTADWMAAFARRNASTGFFDLGPPMYVVSEDTNPNVTRNPAFELAYWRFGLERAQTWVERLGEEVPDAWTDVREHLAPVPVENGLYAVYEGIESDFWTTTAYTNDHPALVGLYGWLPKTANVSIEIANATAEKVWTSWNISNCWGWDFPMLAMSAARNGEMEKAIEWLLHPFFQFDDVGMPVGGVRVPTPYFPGAGALLYAVAMMAAGWDGSTTPAPGFPTDGWKELLPYNQVSTYCLSLTTRERLPRPLRRVLSIAYD
ncbi:hypothetical protein A0H81_02150 [Grifola frondosa]|uniref:Alpha-L-rhamnosidase six-hairpin glycosidase domain-containing protein n=1 Tax=Grifola frondosa TaxID=5627 RepID=A0A1C7MLU6_GRIFR|nr:hypothetical protein A0H81_02150 [Grifola frondosa]